MLEYGLQLHIVFLLVQNNILLQEKEPLILAGNTAAGVYHEWPQSSVIVSLKEVPQLKRIVRSEVSLLQALEQGCRLLFKAYKKL